MRNNLVILFLFVFSLLFSQNKFQYKAVDRALKSKIAITDIERNQVKNQYFKQAKDLTAYLPLRYDKTGNTDYTNYLQKGIDLNAKIILPDFPILINFNGLKLKSNSSVLFQKNSKLILKPNSEELYGLIYIENVKNVDVYFANLVGDRDQHLDTKGEWGMGIFIRSSENININNPQISEMWGDGIYIGNLNQPSKNIEVNGAFIDNNRRNGISIIAGEKINIKNSVISNTNGTIPEYGIDIEPNKPDDVLKDIVLSNNTTYNNSKGGLIFGLDNLQGGISEPVDVTVNNHIDYYSDKGIEFYIDRGYQKFTNPIKGTITINGANLYYNKTPMITNDSKEAQIKLNLSNIKNNNVKLSGRLINNFLDKFQKGKMETAQ